MHEWGDYDFDFEELYKAQQWIVKWVNRLSGCYLMSKEKYGTIRWEHIIPPGSGLCNLRTPLRRWWVNRSWLHKKWVRFGWWVTIQVIKKAIKKWPDLKSELVVDFPYEERLPPKLKEIYWSHWQKGD